MDTSPAFLTETEFWTGVTVLIRNYHAVNKKIFACVFQKVIRLNEGIGKESDKYICESSNLTKVEETVGLGYKSSEAEIESVLYNLVANNESSVDCEGFIIFYKFLTKKLQNNIEAVGKIDLVNKSFTCRFKSCEHFEDYQVRFAKNVLATEILTERGSKEKGIRWLDFVLKPKLLKWCKNARLEELCSANSSTQTKSLQLIDLERYNELYKLLKTKYAEKALEYWNNAKESTDPLKFIYEDIAIASYLICLWEQVGPPTGFADLGCGNGLLVYLLTEEGFNGYGYDVRSRKIWSYYPRTTRLVVQTIDPDKFELPAEVDWVIGNHSDELSPWIPIISAMSSYRMHYFLLPCCAYELSGAKFLRRNTGISAYQDFYTYLNNISEKCGYITLKDRLKIPSTKRLALIGIERTYSENINANQNESISKFVEEERIKFGNNISGRDIKLRSNCEKVRNCTQIDKNILDDLVLKIFKHLLTSGNKISKGNDGAFDKWQMGARLRMSDIVKCLQKSDLQSIKAECGGIKTLLRNKHEIFEFWEGDFVGIRKPKPEMAKVKVKQQTVKKRPCFFKEYHPDGCPLASEDCTFIH